MRRVPAILGVTLLAGAGLMVASKLYTYVEFGTFATDGPPPRVDYCGRRYYPSDPPTTQTFAQVTNFISLNQRRGVTRIGTAPSGMPIVGNVLTPDERSRHHTDVCTMVLWVQIGPDAYVGYSLSGGP